MDVTPTYDYIHITPATAPMHVRKGRTQNHTISDGSALPHLIERHQRRQHEAHTARTGRNAGSRRTLMAGPNPQQPPRRPQAPVSQPDWHRKARTLAAGRDRFLAPSATQTRSSSKKTPTPNVQEATTICLQAMPYEDRGGTDLADATSRLSSAPLEADIL
jgi:hypothetical protein